MTHNHQDDAQVEANKIDRAREERVRRDFFPYRLTVADCAGPRISHRFATFEELLGKYVELLRAERGGGEQYVAQNDDRADGSADGPYGEMRYHDGLTDEERDALAEAM